MKQESANNATLPTWTAKVTATRTVDLNYRADSSLQSISRTQGTSGTTPIVSTYSLTTENAKNEGRITSIVQSGLFIGTTATNVTYGYGYDNQGRVASFASPAGTRTYAYDSFDQVTGATGGTQSAEAYAYDKNGNRTGTGVTTSGYNRVTNDGTYTYLYDNEGNRTRRTKTSNGEYETCDFDYRQRMVKVTKKSSANAVIQTVDYEYDGLDRRIRRTVSNAAGSVTDKQRFLYDSNVLNPSYEEQVIVLDERAAGLSYQQVDHRYMNGPAIDQVFADEASGTGNQVLWYLSDLQNTVRDVAKYVSTGLNGKATVYNHLEYDSFGNVTADNPTTTAVNDGHLPGLEGTGTVNQYSPQRSYTGREPDSATGLIYYRARWFDPNLGRFISEDPIGFAAGDANLSRYVGNSSPNATDPSGLDDRNSPHIGMFPTTNSTATQDSKFQAPRSKIVTDPDGNWWIEDPNNGHPVCRPAPQINVQVRAFVPDDQVWFIGEAVTLKGDNRGVSQTPDDRFRIYNGIVLDPNDPRNGIPIDDIGESTMYFYRLERWTPDGLLAFHDTGRAFPFTDAKKDGSVIHIKIKNEGYIPRTFCLTAVAPAINYRVEGFMSPVPEGTVMAIFRLRHDGFPGYEMYVNNVLVYSFNPRENGQGPLSLLGNGEFENTIEFVVPITP